VVQGVVPEFKPQYHQKKRKERKECIKDLKNSKTISGNE
jgi:hypothetical protein